MSCCCFEVSKVEVREAVFRVFDETVIKRSLIVWGSFLVLTRLVGFQEPTNHSSQNSKILINAEKLQAKLWRKPKNKCFSDISIQSLPKNNKNIYKNSIQAPKYFILPAESLLNRHLPGYIILKLANSKEKQQFFIILAKMKSDWKPIESLQNNKTLVCSWRDIKRFVYSSSPNIYCFEKDRLYQFPKKASFFLKFKNYHELFEKILKNRKSLEIIWNHIRGCKGTFSCQVFKKLQFLHIF